MTDRNEQTTPSVVFIIPYRDRDCHKHFFTQYMTDHILKNVSYSYKIFFAHQADSRKFNRGAMKNIGFIHTKQLYPDTYKDITFVFNDVDTIPHKADILDYPTKNGIVKHFYGFEFALGGIFSITGSDFEKTRPERQLTLVISPGLYLS